MTWHTSGDHWLSYPLAEGSFCSGQLGVASSLITQLGIKPRSWLLLWLPILEDSAFNGFLAYAMRG
jgi:hypothetical protein